MLTENKTILFFSGVAGWIGCSTLPQGLGTGEAGLGTGEAEAGAGEDKCGDRERSNEDNDWRAFAKTYGAPWRVQGRIRFYYSLSWRAS